MKVEVKLQLTDEQRVKIAEDFVESYRRIFLQNCPDNLLQKRDADKNQLEYLLDEALNTPKEFLVLGRFLRFRVSEIAAFRYRSNDEKAQHTIEITLKNGTVKETVLPYGFTTN